MAASPNYCIEWAIECGFRTGRHGNGGPFNVWIYPAPFCVALFINVPRYVELNAPTKEQIAANPNNYRRANVYFDALRNVRSATEYVQPD